MTETVFHFIGTIVLLIALAYIVYKLKIVYKQLNIAKRNFDEKSFKEKLDNMINQNEKNNSQDLNENF